MRALRCFAAFARRLAPCGATLALVGAPATAARAQARAASSEASARVGASPPRVAVAPPAPSMATWCVGAGAPVQAPPLVDAAGHVYIATTDAYLHAFEPDGRYRWSYTVVGAIVGKLALRPSDGAVLLGTAERRMYGISSRGTLAWMATTLAPVLTGLSRAEGDVVFGGGDRFLYAVSSRGGSRWRTPLGGFAVGEPLAHHGAVWLGVNDELLRVEGAWRARRFALPGPVEDSPFAWSRGVAVVAGGALVALDADGAPQFTRDDVAYAAAGARAVWAVSSAGQVTALDERGEARAACALDSAPSAAPLVAADASGVYVPLMDGRLGVVSASGACAGYLPVAAAPLRSPIEDAPRRQLIVGVAGGTVCAVPLASAAPPAPAPPAPAQAGSADVPAR